MKSEKAKTTDYYLTSLEEVGYRPRSESTDETYKALGFKSGLEVHQQLKTRKKLFCNCPTGVYQVADDYDAEVVRHMRPTLSEMGEYDGTALMERKTRKNIVYRLKYDTACTYEIDDTPPFHLNMDAVDISVELSLLLGLSIVSEIHITRKQYLDGSIPAGFQRTAIIGIEGTIPVSNGTVRIAQLSLEEDSCREISDVGHWRHYRTDRLGIPLSETVTYPDMTTPDQIAEAAQYIRYLARSTGKVFTGIGAARQDLNVSIENGSRVEIKGVSHIRWMPELSHNEAFRQKALLHIKSKLLDSIGKLDKWNMSSAVLQSSNTLSDESEYVKMARMNDDRLIVVCLPRFKKILSHFTQPDLSFADELRGRLKVIACLEHPNLIHSEELSSLSASDWNSIRTLLEVSEEDAVLLIRSPKEDIATALETIEERCRLAFLGVPEETRKALENGTTIFERVLPGPDRMYPDTDTAPIAIAESTVAKISTSLPPAVSEGMKLLTDWSVPESLHEFLLRHNLVVFIEQVCNDFSLSHKAMAVFLGQDFKNVIYKSTANDSISTPRLYEMFEFMSKNGLHWELAKALLPVMAEHPKMTFESLLITIGQKKVSLDELLEVVPVLDKKFESIRTTRSKKAKLRWILGQLRFSALGNLPLTILANEVKKRLGND